MHVLKIFKLASEFEQLLGNSEQLAKSLGAILDVSKRNKTWHIHKLEIPKQKRKMGIGSKLMKLLTEEADREGALITLSPSTDFGATSVNRLKNFYKRFDFVENKGRNIDLTLSESMYRLPKK